jgi:hypothetical protein
MQMAGALRDFASHAPLFSVFVVPLFFVLFSHVRNSASLPEAVHQPLLEKSQSGTPKNYSHHSWWVAER